MRQLLIGEKVEFPLTSRVSIRVYADCRPHALQTKLQKGVYWSRTGESFRRKVSVLNGDKFLRWVT
jgi:hypothetical protein